MSSESDAGRPPKEVSPIVFAAILALLASTAFVLSEYTSVGQASAIATLTLAIVTILTVFQNENQSKQIREQADQMRAQSEYLHRQATELSDQTAVLREQTSSLQEELQIKSRPQIAIYRDDRKLIFHNTGNFLTEVTVSISLAELNCSGEQRKILDENVGYEDLPSEVKLKTVSNRDWQNFTMFLQESKESLDRKRYDLFDLIGHHVFAQQSEHMPIFYWLRIDAHLNAKETNKQRTIKFLFKCSCNNENPDKEIFSPTSFEEVGNELSDS